MTGWTAISGLLGGVVGVLVAPLLDRPPSCRDVVQLAAACAEPPYPFGTALLLGSVLAVAAALAARRFVRRRRRAGAEQG